MQASARVVETFDVPTTGAAPAHGEHASGPTPRRIPRRAIEIAGIVIGIGLVASVARSTALSNDEFWSLAAGQWMLAHHSFMGLDPFSYTESHRRWVTDEWGSEITLAELFRLFGNAAYSLYAILLGGLCLVTSAAYARALGPGVVASPPSSSCSPSASPGSWRATGDWTSPWCGSRSSS